MQAVPAAPPPETVSRISSNFLPEMCSAFTAAAQQTMRTTSEGLQISSSQVQRLEKKRKIAKDTYDSLKNNQLTNHGKEEDAARRKKEDQTLMELRKQIKSFDT